MLVNTKVVEAMVIESIGAVADTVANSLYSMETVDSQKEKKEIKKFVLLLKTMAKDPQCSTFATIVFYIVILNGLGSGGRSGLEYL